MPAVYRNRDVRRSDPFFDRDDNLCILCGRCIRVCEEVRGASVLSFVRRGGRTEVGTAFDRTLLDSGCRFCGACVDVCPTAALVERAARPQPRPDRTAAVVCPFCAQGCRLDLGIREDRVLHAGPADAPPNHGQACVKGRFLVRGALDGPGRILEPRVRRDGRLVPATFDEALDAAAAGLASAAEGRRALVYPAQVPLEDAFVFLEFGRAVFRAGAVAASPEPSTGTEARRLRREERRPRPGGPPPRRDRDLRLRSGLGHRPARPIIRSPGSRSSGPFAAAPGSSSRAGLRPVLSACRRSSWISARAP